MPLWKKLYGLVWLNFFALALALFKSFPTLAHLHALIGILIILVAYQNKKALDATSCPDRIKRIAKVITMMAVAALISGSLLKAPLPEWILGAFKFLHITFIAALFAQSASVATAHDMWAEGEFSKS